MKYIKLFKIPYEHKLGVSSPNHLIINVPMIFNYIGIDIYDYKLDYNLNCKYDIDVKEFLKEIFLNKKIKFKSINNDRLNGNPRIEGVVEDLELFLYKEIYVKVKISDEWYLINNSHNVRCSEYDADNKPLHKKLEILKTAEKYNI